MKLLKSALAAVLLSSLLITGCGDNSPSNQYQASSDSAPLREMYERGSIRVASADDSFWVLNQNGQTRLGPQVDLMNDLASRLQQSIRWVSDPRGAARSSLERGFHDVGLLLPINPLDAVDILFTQPLFNERIVLLWTGPEASQPPAWQDQNAPTVLVRQGSSLEADLKNWMPQAEVQPTSPEQQLGADGDQNGLLWGLSRTEARSYLARGSQGRILAEGPVTAPLALTVSRQFPELVGFLNSWIDIIQADGSLQSIKTTWNLD